MKAAKVTSAVLTAAVLRSFLAPRSFASSLVPALVPQTVEGEYRGAVLRDPRDSVAHPANRAINDADVAKCWAKEGQDGKVEEVGSHLVRH